LKKRKQYSAKADVLGKDVNVSVTEPHPLEKLSAMTPRNPKPLRHDLRVPKSNFPIPETFEEELRLVAVKTVLLNKLHRLRHDRHI
jgi:hypothetical protein